MRHYKRPLMHDYEITNSSAPDCYRPLSDMCACVAFHAGANNGGARARAHKVLKHYMYMSFEWYMETRGRNKVHAGGGRNHWSAKPLSTWLRGNFTSRTPCTDNQTGAEFTMKMVPLVRKAIEERVKTAPAVFERVIAAWL